MTRATAPAADRSAPVSAMTASEPTIRPYRAGDGSALRAIWTAAGFRLIGDDDAGLDAFARRNPGTFLVAVDGDRIVGSAMGAWDGRRGWLYHVAVVPEVRRLGLGSALVAAAEAALRAAGCRRVLVLVETANEPALSFWRARGYAPRDTRQLAKSL
jgi:ribosomal protein S18 acetylase RimI-like enzyme